MINKDTKKCPFCNKEIQAQAKKCKHCGKWLPEETYQTSCADNKTIENQSVKKATVRNKKVVYILGGIVAVIILLFVVSWLGLIPSGNSGFTMNMLDELSFSHNSSNKSAVIGRYSTKDVHITDLKNDVWETTSGLRVSTPRKDLFDEWCSLLTDFRYNNIIDNDSITVYNYRDDFIHEDNLFIVWKNAVNGVYYIDVACKQPNEFSRLITKRNDKQRLLEFANHIPIPYDGIMLSTKGDRIIILPKEESDKKLSLLSISPSDTTLRPFYPPNGKNWNIIYCWWGERLSKVIYQNPNADKLAQMEFWNYDCVDDEWSSILEAPALSIDRKPDSKVTVTWKVANGKTVSVTDYTYTSKFEIPKEEEDKSSNTTYSLSLANLMEICGKRRNEALAYLKSQGLSPKDGGRDNEGKPIYYFEVPNGTISINNEGLPHVGTGAVEFLTTSRTQYSEWVRQLKAANYHQEDDDIWCGDNAHYYTFRLINLLDAPEEDDYCGAATLCVTGFPMVYDEEVGHYIDFEYKY